MQIKFLLLTASLFISNLGYSQNLVQGLFERDTQSDVLITKNVIFSQRGVVSSIQWAPENYTTGFKFDIFYYIPATLTDTTNAKSMIFLHGGGQSTMTREGSARVARSYIEDLKTIADQLGLVLIAPSASGLNWSGQTRTMMRDLAKLVRVDLKVDPNKMALSGHSMGGMGITRNYMWLTDQFSFIMPIAAGMDEKVMTEENLVQNFNTTYYHMQGLADHFDVFITRCRLQDQKVKELEALYGKKSGFKLELYNGSHNYDKTLMTKRLIELYKLNRNFYQNELHGSLYYANEIMEYNGIKFNFLPTPKYFWVEGISFDANMPRTRTNFKAKIENNEIHFTITNKETSSLRRARFYISKKQADLQQPVRVIVNNELKFEGKISINPTITSDSTDAGFLFDGFVEVDV